MTEELFVADYTDALTPLDRYFLVGDRGKQVIGCWHAANGLMACIIEDDSTAEACKDFLRKRGHPSFASLADAQAHAARMRWPGWERA